MKFIYNGRFRRSPRVTGVERFASSMLEQLQAHLMVREVLPPISGAGAHLWEQLVLPFYTWFSRDILINPINTAPLFARNSIVVIHDLAFMAEPQWFSRSFRIYYSFLIPIVAKFAWAIVTVSQFSKNELIRRLEIPPSKVFVVRNGVLPMFRPVPLGDHIRQQYGLPSDYLLYIGSLEPRKNLRKVIEGFGRLVQLHPELPHKLVIVGARGKNFSQVALEAGLGRIRDRVLFLGFMPDEHLPEIISGASLFAYLSFYEGFGLPPLEAAACGAPVLTTRCGAVEEILGDAARYVDPQNEEAIAQAMFEILSEKAVQQVMRTRGLERVAAVSWEAAGAQFASLLRQIGGEMRLTGGGEGAKAP